MKIQYQKNFIFTEKDFKNLCDEINKYKKIKNISIESSIWGTAINILFYGMKKKKEYFLSSLDERYVKCEFILLGDFNNSNIELKELINTHLYKNTNISPNIISNKSLNLIRNYIDLEHKKYKVYTKKTYSKEYLLLFDVKNKKILLEIVYDGKDTKFLFNKELNFEEFSIINKFSNMYEK